MKCSKNRNPCQGEWTPWFVEISKGFRAWTENGRFRHIRWAITWVDRGHSKFVTKPKMHIIHTLFTLGQYLRPCYFQNCANGSHMFVCVFVCLFKPDEIGEVKRLSINFVRKISQKKGSSFTYILVPFSDPGRWSFFFKLSILFTNSIIQSPLMETDDTHSQTL